MKMLSMEVVYAQYVGDSDSRLVVSQSYDPETGKCNGVKIRTGCWTFLTEADKNRFIEEVFAEPLKGSEEVCTNPIAEMHGVHHVKREPTPGVE